MRISSIRTRSSAARQTRLSTEGRRRSVLPFIDRLRRVKAKRRLYIVYGKACGFRSFVILSPVFTGSIAGKSIFPHFLTSSDIRRRKSRRLFLQAGGLYDSEGSVARQSRYTGYTVSPIRGSFSRFSCHGRASRQLFSCSKTACCSLMEKMAEEIAFMIAFPFVNFNFCMHYTIRFSICHSTCG